ncbi:MAG: prepilin peptidase [Sedimentisphaerales bacterium]|nr:prepilin peptidase [Sedimentisphaerales bacterium]
MTCALIPDGMLILFIFAVGACVGSFLNVVIYRLPRDMSIVRPGSSCPSCKTPIHFYDNIPLVSWFVLRGKCRQCQAKISPRYFIIELITALLFIFVYMVYFMTSMRKGVGGFFDGGFLLYLVHIIMLAAFLATSAIDLELQVIPLTVCWLVTAAGIIGSVLAPFFYEPVMIRSYDLFPMASAKTSIMAIGALLGLVVSMVLLVKGKIKPSYIGQDEMENPDTENAQTPQEDDENYNHRLEMLKEVIYLLPILIGAFLAYIIYKNISPFQDWWIDFSQRPVIAGLCGSLWGYFMGCTVVWTTRILGTFTFGREAMGLGDVHLMGAAGAVLGPWPVVVAFFVAPFFGLSWALISMFFKKIRQIPYGPFLSIGLFVVMILHDAVVNWLQFLQYR